jgi:hypothetical protein
LPHPRVKLGSHLLGLRLPLLDIEPLALTLSCGRLALSLTPGAFPLSPSTVYRLLVRLAQVLLGPLLPGPLTL